MGRWLPELTFWASSTAPDTDFVAELTDMAPDGTSIQITRGWLNGPRSFSRSRPRALRPHRAYGLEPELWPMSYVFRPGHRIRLSLAGSDAGLPPNPHPAAVTVSGRQAALLHDAADAVSFKFLFTLSNSEKSSMRRGAALLLAILVAATAAGCGGSTDNGNGADAKVEDWGAVLNEGGEPVRGGTLRIATSFEPPGISPLYFNLEVPDGATIRVVMQMFDQLVELLPGSLDPQPGLAERWELSDDGLSYTFKLRRAKFSNGMPVTAADVKYSLDLVRGDASFFVDLFTSISRIETPDDSTVVIHLSERTPALLDYLAFPGASIVPAKVLKSEGVEAFNRNPIGSGAFKLEEWRRNQEVVLSRHENYWREGLPYLDEVRLITTQDDNTRVLDVTSGTVDAADYVPFSQIKRIDSGRVATVLRAPGAETFGIEINNSKKPLDETAVRQALNHATPAESIIDVVFQGLAPRANTIVPKLKYWTDQAKAYPYDLDKARELLAQSSVPDGFSLEIIIQGGDEASRQVAQILQDSWGKIGIDVKVEQLDDAASQELIVNGKHDVYISRPGDFTSDVAVEDQFAQLMLDSPPTDNLFRFSGETEATKYARKAIHELDDERRAEYFAQMHVASMEDPPTIPIAYTPNRIAVANKVHDFNYLLTGWWRLDTVWIASE